MKVVIVNNLLGYYGAENVLVNMANHLSEFYDITVLTLRECDRRQLHDRVKYKCVFKTGGGFTDRLITKVKLILGYRFLAKVYLGKRKYDVGIAFKTGESAKMVGYSSIPRKFCWLHSNMSALQEKCSYSFSSLQEEIEFLAGKFERMIAVSQACRASFLEKYGSRSSVQVIYNPVDAEVIREKAKETIAEQSEEYAIFRSGLPVIGTVARLDETQKRLSWLIQISKRLHADGIPHHCVLLGDGADRGKYEAARGNMEREYIHLLGFRENPYPLLTRFSCFVCCSVWESYSIVVNEALVLGVPVVSTRCGGPEEVLEQGKYGTLVNDIEEMYQAVREQLVVMHLSNAKYDSARPMRHFVAECRALIEGDSVHDD